MYEADRETRPRKHQFLRTPYNYDMDYASDASGLSCPEPTLTQQQFKDEADINVILERFGITGQLPTNVRTPLPADFQAITNFHEAANQIRAAQEAFMEMPANVRARFQNDPGQFLDFVNNEENRAEAEKLGIINPRPVPAPTAQAHEPASGRPGGDLGAAPPGAGGQAAGSSPANTVTKG